MRSDMKSYDLNLSRYLTESELDKVPNKPGVYCFYLFRLSNVGRWYPSELLYIGEAKKLDERLNGNHEKIKEIKNKYGLKMNNRLRFSYAEVDASGRERVEATLIYNLKPKFNEQLIDKFPYPPTEIYVHGHHDLIPDYLEAPEPEKDPFEMLI